MVEPVIVRWDAGSAEHTAPFCMSCRWVKGGDCVCPFKRSALAIVDGRVVEVV